MSPRTRRIGCFAALIVGVGVVVLIATEIVPRSKYGYTSRRIREKINSLRDRKPAVVDATQWNECVDWAVNAHCNICFSEGHTRYQEMRRFEIELDGKLNGDVGPDTLEWIFNRLAASGPAGERYINRFKAQWADALAAVAR